MGYGVEVQLYQYITSMSFVQGYLPEEEAGLDSALLSFHAMQLVCIHLCSPSSFNYTLDDHTPSWPHPLMAAPLSSLRAHSHSHCTPDKPPHGHNRGWGGIPYTAPELAHITGKGERSRGFSVRASLRSHSTCQLWGTSLRPDGALGSKRTRARGPQPPLAGEADGIWQWRWSPLYALISAVYPIGQWNIT